MVVIERLAQRVRLRVAHEAVIAVDGGLHAFEQRPGWLQRRRKLAVFRQSLPTAAHGLLTTGELKAVSHHALADLNALLEELGKQATGWQQWFEQSTGNARAD